MNRTSAATARLSVLPAAAPGPAERLLFASGSLLVCRIDADGRVADANEAFERFRGGQVDGLDVLDLAHPSARATLDGILADPAGVETGVVVALAGQVEADPTEAVVRVVRDHLGALLTAEIVVLDRPPAPSFAPPHSVVVVELDGDDSVVERYGHDVGDALVASVAAVIEVCARRTDHVTRGEGASFSVVLDDCVLDDAIVWAERVRARLREIRSLGNGEAVTACFGVAERHPGEGAGGTAGRAARALRIAREDGRDTVRAAR